MKVVKEIIIILLMCLAIMLILAVALYQYLPSRKEVPAIQKYSTTEEIQDLLEDDIMARAESEAEPELRYNVTSSDLNKYQVTEDYVPGKLHPFAEYSGSSTVEQPNGETNADGSGNEITGQNIQTQEPSVYTNGSGGK